MEDLTKHVLITGGAGYIGSVLPPTLLKEGCNVTVIDNLTYNQSTLMDYCYLDNFAFIRGDARNEDLIKELMKKVDMLR